MAVYVKAAKEFQEARTTPELLAMQKRSAILSKSGVNAIAVSEKDVFVACSETKGYGFAVWRLDRDLGEPKKIVEGLRGCCGQMDIQAHGGDLYVAENARKRVVRYDRNGKELAAWGESERQGVVGFGSCCNPMNIRFGPGGELLTSESNLGRIKRFQPDGQFLGIAAEVAIVPGCKHVAIGISSDGKRMYLLDITRSHIVALKSARRRPPWPRRRTDNWGSNGRPAVPHIGVRSGGLGDRLFLLTVRLGSFPFSPSDCQRGVELRAVPRGGDCRLSHRPGLVADDIGRALADACAHARSHGSGCVDRTRIP